MKIKVKIKVWGNSFWKKNKQTKNNKKTKQNNETKTKR